MEKLEEFEFKAINQNLMSCIDFLIVNNKIADVNDQQWKTIKNYMSDICGMDLSTGFIVKENIYDIIKKNIYEKNSDILIKNEIFGTINMLLTAKDDSILLILNLLFYCEISFYKEKNKTGVNDININSNNINNNDMLKNKYDKDNQIIDINSIENYNNSNIENNKNIDSNKNNINNINDDIIQKIQDELIDDEEKKNNNNKGLNENKDHMEINMNLDEINNYNILNKNFFQLDLTNSKNLFNFLLKLLLIPRNLRSITNEIILFNISVLLNLNKNREKKEFIIKIQEIFKNEITKLRNILNQDKSLKSLTYITSVKALEQYINPMDKKIKDLISSPFILIPLIYLDEQEDVPQNFKEIKFNYQILNAYIMKILILYDMLNDLFNCQYDMIIETKKNPFELPKQADFLVGKEYFNLDLGKENILCELIINKKIIKAVIFFDFQNVYFGQIMTNSYKNLSKIKLVKKYNLRNIEVKIPNSNESFENENTLLEIYDGTQEKNNILGQSNRLVINCFEVEKTVIVYKQLKKEKNNAIQLEFSLFDSFLDAIEKKFSVM
jgi:hypothetical protein